MKLKLGVSHFYYKSPTEAESMKFVLSVYCESRRAADKYYWYFGGLAVLNGCNCVSPLSRPSK